MAANSPQEDRPDSHSKRTHSPHSLTGKSTVGRARSSPLSLCCLSLARRYVIDSSLCGPDVGLASAQPLTFLCYPMALIYKTLVRCPEQTPECWSTHTTMPGNMSLFVDTQRTPSFDFSFHVSAFSLHPSAETEHSSFELNFLLCKRSCQKAGFPLINESSHWPIHLVTRKHNTCLHTHPQF